MFVGSESKELYGSEASWTSPAFGYFDIEAVLHIRQSVHGYYLVPLCVRDVVLVKLADLTPAEGIAS
ncbi:MAG: hypothetical protein KDD45_08050 [Bdellovibrionales bacterium]|nr:hypothetical protein [Bdellovibrionales bacterium]